MLIVLIQPVLAVVCIKTIGCLSDIDYVQQQRPVSIELEGGEREYWQSKNKRGQDEKKVTQTVGLACEDLTL